MRLFVGLSIALTAICCQTVFGGDVILRVDDTDGISARTAAPVSMRIDLAKHLTGDADPARLQLVELTGADATPGDPIPVQFEADGRAGQGTLWFQIPPGPKGQRRFRLTLSEKAAPPAMTVAMDNSGSFYDVRQGDRPVLRYNHGNVPVPEGVPAQYQRGDYISPLYGLSGEVLTDDYPRDHPHHRGIGWSWPVTRWGDEVRDIWAVRGVWSRPVKMRRTIAGPVVAVVEAENVWKWGDSDKIVREEVLIRAFRSGQGGRCVDVEVRLTALADNVAIGGRPHAGYGGFGLRAAAAEQQKITAHTDPQDAPVRRSWLDYSGVFAGGGGISGVTILEHPSGPGYPSELLQYPQINYVMPGFPGQREVALSKEKPLVLNHRLWIHGANADEDTLADVWRAYAQGPTVTIENRN